MPLHGLAATGPFRLEDRSSTVLCEKDTLSEKADYPRSTQVLSKSSAQPNLELEPICTPGAKSKVVRAFFR
jgi:hypothetical protein